MTGRGFEQAGIGLFWVGAAANLVASALAFLTGEGYQFAALQLTVSAALAGAVLLLQRMNRRIDVDIERSGIATAAARVELERAGVELQDAIARRDLAQHVLAMTRPGQARAAPDDGPTH